jgi:butyryl-CoA dehydrogenase
MNKARLYTGLQGVAIAERATQHAMAYAKLRRQGRAPSRALGADPSQSSEIIDHPDVRRNLMTMKALTAAARAVAYSAAEAIDRADAAEDPAERAHAEELAALLTPITKAYCSDLGVEVASIGVQVHGGMGFVEETGAAQYLRDARIAPIYEGTNGIQAIDLVLRKVLRPGSRIMADAIAAFRRTCVDAADAGLDVLGSETENAVDALALATDFLSINANDTETLLAVASPYLRLAGVACAAAYLTKGAARATRRQKSGENAPVLTDAVALAQFYAANFAVAAPSLAEIVLNSAAGLKLEALTSDFH